MILKIIGFGIVGGIIFSILQYLKSRFGYKNSKSYGKEAKLSFKTVADIYKVNPNRWDYSQVIPPGYTTITGTGKVLLYNANNSYHGTIFWPNMKSYSYANTEENYAREKIIRIHLSYFGWLKLRYYYLFKRAPSRGTRLVFKTAQKDIDKLREQAQAEIKSASDGVSAIMKRLENERKETMQK